MDSEKDKSRLVPEKNQLSVPELLQGKCFREDDEKQEPKEPDPRIKSPDEFLRTVPPQVPKSPLPPHFNAVDYKLEEFAKTYSREKELWIRYHERVNKWKDEARKAFRSLQQEVLKIRLYKSEIVKLRSILKKKDQEIAQLKDNQSPPRKISNL